MKVVPGPSLGEGCHGPSPDELAYEAGGTSGGGGDDMAARALVEWVSGALDLLLALPANWFCGRTGNIP